MMRSLLFVVVSVTALLVAGMSREAIAQSETVNGLVMKIDESAGKITIKHGPMKKFELDEGHTMVFRAQDPAMLKTVKVGDKIKFEADRVNGQFTVMKLEKAM
jgi:Cu(I)/Ag(I) efflux system protein CusF